MPLDHHALSARNMGLILLNKKHPSAYAPDVMAEPFDEILEFMQENPEWTNEDLYQKFPATELDNAKHDARSLNGSSKEVDWAAMLRESHTLWKIGENLERAGHQLKKGKKPDLLGLSSEMRSVSTNPATGLVSSKDIDWESAVDLQPSGWDAFDNTLGGMAAQGLIVVYGATKTGKSYFVRKFLDKFLHFYPERKAGAFPLELRDARFLKDGFEMYPSLLEPHNEGRLLVTSQTRRVEEIASEVISKAPDIVVIDGINDLVKGDFDSSKFARTWKSLVELSVIQNIPIIVTAQPNRMGKWEAESKFIHKYHIEWSGEAENSCEQLIALQYVQDEMSIEDDTFPTFSDAYYVISWLQRAGWKKQQGPGAFVFREHGGKLWEGPAYKNMLYPVGSARQIGDDKPKKSRRKKK
jgi:hypothetical protein